MVVQNRHEPHERWAVRDWLTHFTARSITNIKKDTSPAVNGACLFFARLLVGSCTFVMRGAKLPQWT